MDFETYKKNRLSGLSPEESYATQNSQFSLGRTLGNVPKSAGQFLGGIAGAVAHPVQTVKALGGVAAGAVEKLIPGQQAEEKYIDSLGSFYKERYGSFDSFLSTLENDPVGVASDLSLVLTGGGAIASKLGTLSKASTLTKAGQTVSTIGRSINPINTLGGLTKTTQSMFPRLSRVLEKSNLRLTKTKEGALSTRMIANSDEAINITKNRLNEITEYLSSKKLVGTPTGRYLKISNLYNKTEDVLDKFFGSMSKGSVAKTGDITKSLNGLKSVYRGDRDYSTIVKQIDGAIKELNRASQGGEINYKLLNKFKRSTYAGAYNKAGEKVIDSIEHSIGDVVRGFMDEKLRGLKIAGQKFEEFNHNYGLLIESRKLIKQAIGRREMSAVTESILGGLLGYAVGGATTIGSPAGVLGGLAFGKGLFEALPITGVKSGVSALSRTIGDVKIPAAVRGAKTPLTAVQRIRESQ